MELIDSHAHLDFPHFNADREEVLKRAREAGVTAIINVGTSQSSSRRSVELAGEDPSLWAAVGIHPHYADSFPSSRIGQLASLAEQPRVVAIGETGLDYYRNLSSPASQAQLFRAHLQLARDLNKPLVIHTREAYPETLTILREEQLPEKRGVMHCFSAGREWARSFLELGFYLSIAGPVTYPRSHALRELLKEIPLERLLLETDAPYLSPQAYRGRRNEPAYIRSTYQRVALAMGIEPDLLARQVFANSRRLFGLDER